MKEGHIPPGHRENIISHENGQGHHHDHTGFENGVGTTNFMGTAQVQRNHLWKVYFCLQRKQ